MNKKLLVTALLCAVVFVVGFITIPDVLDRAPSVGAKSTTPTSTTPPPPTTTTSECIPGFDCPTDTNTPTPTTNTTDTRTTVTTTPVDCNLNPSDPTCITGNPPPGCDPSDPACDGVGGGGGVSDPCDGPDCDPVIIDGVSDPTSEEAAKRVMSQNATGICVGLLSCQDKVLEEKCKEAGCDNANQEVDADTPLIIYGIEVNVKPTLNNDKYNAIITSNTNLPANIKMSYQEAMAPPKMFTQRSSTNFQLEKNHIIVLGVKPNSNYFFQLSSRAGSKQATSEIFTFPTPEFRPDVWNLVSGIIKQGN